MNDQGTEESILPKDAFIGSNLDWTAPWEEVILTIELPFWLMVPSCEVAITVADHEYVVEITEHYRQVHVRYLTDSLISCVYQGPFPPQKNVGDIVLAEGMTAMLRKCKTVMRIVSRCNSDVSKAANDDDPKRCVSAELYFISLCGAHIPIVNCLLRAYILQTYDPRVHEVAPWDVPLWFVTRQGGEGFRIALLPSANWDMKPQMFDSKDLDNPQAEGIPFEFASPEDLRRGLLLEPTPGELELAQGMHLRERGDYSGAVRRSVTSLEVLLEARLRQEMSARYPEAEVEERLNKSRNNFPKRLRDYQALSGRQISDTMKKELDRIRDLRHSIVHRGRWLTFEERGVANRSVDFARFIFQWLEDSTEHRKRRERLLVQRQLGMHQAFLHAELTPEGVMVHHLE